MRSFAEDISLEQKYSFANFLRISYFSCKKKTVLLLFFTHYKNNIDFLIKTKNLIKYRLAKQSME